MEPLADNPNAPPQLITRTIQWKLVYVDIHHSHLGNN